MIIQDGKRYPFTAEYVADYKRRPYVLVRDVRVAGLRLLRDHLWIEHQYLVGLGLRRGDVVRFTAEVRQYRNTRQTKKQRKRKQAAYKIGLTKLDGVERVVE